VTAGAGFELTKRVARHFREVERRLFETLGGWVPTVAEPEVKLLLREHSFQHAWHAQLWEELLPARDDEGLGGEGFEGLGAVLDAVAEPAATLERLVGAYRVVLPRLVVAYSGMRADGAVVGDGPLRRALRLMLADDVDAWQAGEGLVQGCITSPAEAELAGRHAARVEALLVAAGGLWYTEED
jgi:hypothetical protein